MKIFKRWKFWKVSRKKSEPSEPLDQSEKLDKAAANHEAKRILAETKAKIKVKKPKPPKDKLSQRLEEFPIKMVKEVNKIKWSTKENLTKKYLEVLIFIVLFAVFFALIDWGFQAIFSLIKVI